ncbi:MAG: phage tail sheath subtilisin-like domain-containing protein [Flavobacteriales bacterium]
MTTDFLHGVEVINIDSGPHPIRTVKSSVIGLVGTAPEADDEAFPLNTPVIIAGSRTKAAKLGTKGTLPGGIASIFDQVGAVVVVVRVKDLTVTPSKPTKPGDKQNDAATDASSTGKTVDKSGTTANIIGAVDAATGQYTGVQAFLAAESIVHVRPRILIAPGFSHLAEVATALDTVAGRLRAVAIVDGPNTNDEAVKTYATSLSASRLFLVEPKVKAWSAADSATIEKPSSSYVAGLIAKTDSERGFWWSPSNQEIKGIIGTARPIDFSLGDTSSRANILNEGNIATIIHQNGYRLWGNRMLSSGAFINIQRTADTVADSIQRAHLWAVDRNITTTYIEDVTEGVNNYLRELKAQGAIIDGKCWADPDLNQPSSIEKGAVYFDFDFTPNYPAERVTFRQHIVNDYLEELFS